MKKLIASSIVVLIVVGIIVGVKWAERENLTAHSMPENVEPEPTEQVEPIESALPGEDIKEDTDEDTGVIDNEEPETPSPSPSTKPKTEEEALSDMEESIAVIGEPELMEVLVNPNNRLPDSYEPSDLVYPDVRFVFSEMIDKRKMRQEAADALEEMFAAAEQDGYFLAGVSGYRSHAYQKQLFERYVKKDGLEKASTYSAYPGTSEHETGLAMDVTRSDGKCAASDCFGDMEEATWVADHAHEYGYIVRYPEGKQHITGYKYEPWHLRYVGKELADQLYASDQTLEEYYNAVPVSR